MTFVDWFVVIIATGFKRKCIQWCDSVRKNELDSLEIAKDKNKEKGEVVDREWTFSLIQTITYMYIYV